jgi:hypothetical protein
MQLVGQYKGDTNLRCYKIATGPDEVTVREERGGILV